MKSARCITLTTDFGVRDWFVGTMKGVIHSLAPRAAIIDLTHEIEPGNLPAGAFALAASYSFFPRNTIHLAVVDPGVGGPRRAIAVQTTNYIFVGPDNGLFSWALAKEKIKAIHALANESYFLPRVSASFHGRDIFAPVAAHLSQGTPVHRLGPVLSDCIRLKWPEPKQTSQGIRGEVLYIDGFGNAITNIPTASLRPTKSGFAVFMGRRRICAVAPYYQAVAPGRPVAVAGSTGLLEIAVNGGIAAKVLRIRIGDFVQVRAAGRPTPGAS